MWGDRVVYDGWYTYSEEIYMYDIPSGVTTNITNDDFDGRRNQRTSSIWEERIVYVDGPYASTEQNADILMKIITGVDPVPVCTNSAAQLWPEVFGDLVVWIDYRNDPCPNLECRGTNTDIYYYRISTGSEHRLTSAPGIEATARVLGNRIFFVMRDSAGIYSIFMKEAEP